MAGFFSKRKGVEGTFQGMGFEVGSGRGLGFELACVPNSNGFLVGGLWLPGPRWLVGGCDRPEGEAVEVGESFVRARGTKEVNDPQN